jgi:hypothetical protein
VFPTANKPPVKPAMSDNDDVESDESDDDADVMMVVIKEEMKQKQAEKVCPLMMP